MAAWIDARSSWNTAAASVTASISTYSMQGPFIVDESLAAARLEECERAAHVMGAGRVRFSNRRGKFPHMQSGHLFQRGEAFGPGQPRVALQPALGSLVQRAQARRMKRSTATVAER